MKAMILAAGKGTRVRPLTHLLPKPMIPLIRKPIMEALIEHLRRHSFDEIYINTSMHSNIIEDYFRDGERFGVSIAYSYEGLLVDGQFADLPVGSAGGMRRIQDRSGFFDSTFAVLCGDAYIDVDLTEALRFHRARGALATIVTKTVPQEEVSRYGVVDANSNGRIKRFQEKPKPHEAASNNVNTGIYLFEPRIFEFIAPGVSFDIGSQLFPALVAAGEKLYSVSLPFQWVDVGCIADFWDATRLVLTGKVKGMDVPGRRIADRIHVGLGVSLPDTGINISGPVYIGSGTRIARGARIIGPTVIGANCDIQSGATINECILSDYTRVTSGAVLEKKIFFGGYCIDPDGKSIELHGSALEGIVDDARKPAPAEVSAPASRTAKRPALA